MISKRFFDFDIIPILLFTFIVKGGTMKEENMKCRIIERTNVDGRVEYVIQQKHFLFGWTWVDAWINSPEGVYCRDSFSTIEEARKNICYFGGSKSTEKVVQSC